MGEGQGGHARGRRSRRDDACLHPHLPPHAGEGAEEPSTMKYLHLIWAALLRSKTRTLLTLLSVVAAFLLFGMLDSVRVAFNSGGSVAGADRLIVASRLSITQMLPY